jgi:uncharacterized membrane protein YjjP (DUF1212 family)
VSTSKKIKLVFAFPLAFLLGVIAMALLQLFQVGGAAMTLILGGGLLLLFLVDHYVGRAGNSAIVRGFAKFTDDPEEARARIDAADAENAKTSFLTRVLQIAGFAAGVLACLVWSPAQVLDWIGSVSFA